MHGLVKRGTCCSVSLMVTRKVRSNVYCYLIFLMLPLCIFMQHLVIIDHVISESLIILCFQSTSKSSLCYLVFCYFYPLEVVGMMPKLFQSNGSFYPFLCRLNEDLLTRCLAVIPQALSLKRHQQKYKDMLETLLVKIFARQDSLFLKSY